MPVFMLDEFEYEFPPGDLAEDGLLAIGGDLHPDRILSAYRNGIFPWFNEDEPPLWWCMDPRFVLYPSEVVVQKSMRSLLRKPEIQVKFNTNFREVVRLCGETRQNQEGTWISPDILDSYTQLHERGYGHSVEVYEHEELVGGLYGLSTNGYFSGESMFALKSNRSKIALIALCLHLSQTEISFIDCQVHTPHLERMGARMISRNQFLQTLANPPCDKITMPANNFDFSPFLPG